MTAQFHEGQEVEVCEPTVKHPDTARNLRWRKAKIVSPYAIPEGLPRDRLNDKFFAEVQFPDGICAVFDAEHIRAVPNRDLAKMTPDELQEDVNDCYCGGGGRP